MDPTASPILPLQHDLENQKKALQERQLDTPSLQFASKLHLHLPDIFSDLFVYCDLSHNASSEFLYLPD
jgi:hypothetical protein